MPPRKNVDIRRVVYSGNSPRVPTEAPLAPLPYKPQRPSVWRRRVKRIALLLLILGLITALAAGGWIVYKLDRTTASHGGILGLLQDHKLNGESTGRVTILLAGDSADDPGHGGAELTDSIMLVTINTTTHKATEVSIPRDLWVNIPGHGYQKINATYEYGQADNFSEAGYASGGMGLLEKVVQSKFGLPIDYYALVDYTGFKAAVNAVNGIDVTIASSDPRGIYDPNISKADDGPLILKNGVDHLDGQTALNLARARNDPTPSGLTGYGLPNGDFDRATNQRLMLAALAKKAASISTLDNPIKIGQLLDAVGNNIQTDLKTDDLQRLYTIAGSLTSSNITSVSLQKYVTNYTAANGASALIPLAGFNNFSVIQAYLSSLLTTPSSSATPVPTPDPTVGVEVLNGTTTAGLAATTASTLTGLGYDVAGSGNALSSYSATTLYDVADNPTSPTLKLLEARYGVTAIVDTALASRYNAAIVLVVGGDQAAAN